MLPSYVFSGGLFVRLMLATHEHKAFVRAHLRPSVIQDMHDAQGTDIDIAKAFDFSIHVSTHVHAFVLDDGRCAGLAGVCPEPFHDNAGFPWFMGTPLMHEEERGVLRCSRAMIGFFYDVHPWSMLVTYVSSHNPVSLRWLTRWLGFAHVRDIDNYAAATIPFHLLVHHPDARSSGYDRTLFQY